MAHQVDRVLNDLDAAMLQLKKTMHGIPVRKEGFKSHHDRAARAIGRLTAELQDASAAINT
ncbi:hypothetical protein BAY61_26450 [Prauserella marina]|uniref:Uncharacterized protein n=1 Tax=Prauserella marina TaxID=530584 RepID=A0A222VW63_9PSEU|nr:hypothetical protein [Prauserella marina]ASR37963.1 hypothetical protein BAY61_26450 [Prauserella marina]PWV73188.1 hypothetical protein DES30_109138 [Prauserella marina]SDD69808.1 hypothetical protein SAMN05421630_111135 [Prauserella marina]